MNNLSQRNLQKGLLIVFEGIDGTGKSTQIDLLAQYLIDRNYPVVKTREPTDGQYGMKIRELYSNRNAFSKEEELALFLDDRKEHVEKLIRPSLSENKIVLCDRYFLSTAAYQGTVGFDPQTILEQNSFAPDPDLALLFVIPPELSIERIANRGDSLNDFERLEELRKVAGLFLSLTRPYITTINGSEPIETIQKKIIDIVEDLLSHYQIS